MAGRAPWRARSSQVVDELVQALEREFQQTAKGFNISEIVQGGSLGYGTAVPENHDIDLVLYSRDVRPNEILQAKLECRLNDLDSFLRGKFNRRYKFDRKTQHSLQFDILSEDYELSVDLLISPYWESRSTFYNFLQFSVRPEDRSQLTVCAAKWQVEFFKCQPNQVKEFIRRAKVWRNEQWPKDAPHGGEGRPSSYLMSLLVVRAYEDKQRNPHQTITQALIQLVKDDRKNVYWVNDPSVDPQKYPKLLPQHLPRVIDPANPANNVWESGVNGYRQGEKLSNYEMGDGNTAPLKRKISSIDLSKPIE